MSRLLFFVVAFVFLVSVQHACGDLVLADGVSVDAGSEFFSAINLISTNDMELGTDGLTPDDVFISNSDANSGNSWVTNVVGGNFGDYFAAGGEVPIHTFTFASVQSFNGFVVWSYPNLGGPGNGVSDGTVEFFAGATSLGTENWIANIGTVGGSHQPATLNTFTTTYNGVTSARVSYTDNFFEADNGGARVGAGTVAFSRAVPEPGSAIVVLCGLGALFLRRSRFDHTLVSTRLK